MGLAYAALLALLPLAPLGFIYERFPEVGEVMIQALAYLIFPFVMLFGF